MTRRSAISHRHIRQPANEGEFEVALIDVGNAVFGTDSFDRIGKRGSNQQGGDLRGYIEDDQSQTAIIQGKCREPGKKEKVKDLESDARRAVKKYKPRLFIYATTAQADRKLEDAAEALNKEFREAYGEDACQVRLWDWNKLQDLAARDENVLFALSPEDAVSMQLAAAHTNKMEGINPVEAMARAGLSPERSRTTIINIEHADPDDERTPNSGLITLASEKTLTDPEAALSEYRKLERKSGLLPIDMARIVGGIGNCYHISGDLDAASQHWTEAYQYTPDRHQTMANYLIALKHQDKLEELKVIAEKAIAQHPTESVLIMRAAVFLEDETLITPEVMGTEEGTFSCYTVDEVL